ncbi:MAG: hypothetical protein ACT4OZ_12210 [Gemmatimonadota bacterium]
MRAQVSAERLDSVRVAIDTVFSAPAFRWREVADPWATVRRAWLAVVDAIERLRTDNPMLYRLAVALLVATLLVIVFHAIWVAARTVRGGTRTEMKETAAPVHQRRDAGWYAALADQLAREGRFSEAMQADFQRLILELDARDIVRFHPARTPNEYAVEPGLADDSRQRLGSLVRELYACAFGGFPCGSESWVRWRSRTEAGNYARAN